MNLQRAVLLSLLVAIAVAASGCNGEQRRAEQAAARAAAAEDAATQGEAAFDAAVADGNWALAKAQADVLLAQYPNTEAAGRVQPKLDDVAAKSDAQREERRLAALWLYQQAPVGKGSQRTAVIQARDPVDVDGSGPGPVKLVFRDHPEWGRSSYLVLQAGDFDCYGHCKVAVSVDDQAPKRMPAYRPDTDEAIAMFIDDDRALWRMAQDAKTLTIEFPVKAGGTRKATFETAGLDATQLPW
jgi:hypothetical protein